MSYLGRGFISKKGYHILKRVSESYSGRCILSRKGHIIQEEMFQICDIQEENTWDEI